MVSLLKGYKYMAPAVYRDRLIICQGYLKSCTSSQLHIYGKTVLIPLVYVSHCLSLYIYNNMVSHITSVYARIHVSLDQRALQMFHLFSTENKSKKGACKERFICNNYLCGASGLWMIAPNKTSILLSLLLLYIGCYCLHS